MTNFFTKNKNTGGKSIPYFHDTIISVTNLSELAHYALGSAIIVSWILNCLANLGQGGKRESAETLPLLDFLVLVTVDKIKQTYFLIDLTATGPIGHIIFP
jgi:hypothetical protein